MECRLHAYTANHIKIRNWITLLRSVYAYSFDEYDTFQIRELFETRISQPKVDAVWKMLKIDDKLKTFYNSRINNNLFDKLARQQGKALDYDQIKNKKKRIVKRFEVAQSELTTFQEQERSISSEFSQPR